MPGDALRREPLRPLNGKRIVVTRPAEQAEPLVTAIENAGGIAVRLPVLAINDVENDRPLHDIVERLDQYDLAVFVSPNAVRKALDILIAQRSWPAKLRAVTVGKSSERELARYGITDIIAPSSRFDSEALLELPELQVLNDQRVIIFRGNGGRELLGDTLKKRGASVDYVTCYRRSLPQIDAMPLLKLLEGNHLDAFVITSSEGLRNLLTLLGETGVRWLKQTPLFMPHARIAEEARKLGLQCVVLTAPGDAGLLAGLTEYFV